MSFLKVLFFNNMHLLIVQEEGSLSFYDTHYVVRNIIPLDFIYTFWEMLPFGNSVMETNERQTEKR